MNLRLSKQTLQMIEAYGASPTQALLLSGSSGVGLQTLASHIVSLNGTLLARLQPESKTSSSLSSIPVERVRSLYTETRTRLNGLHFVLIDDADKMNHVAQNALLKLLEEPNKSIRFILTSHAPSNLLATIRSRVQEYVVPPISQIDSRRLLNSLGVKGDLAEKQLLYIASGLPAELTRLASNPDTFKTVSQRVSLARQFIEAGTYGRLVIIQTLKDDRAGSIEFIEMIVYLLKRSVASNPNRSSLELINNLLKACNSIRMNGNIRLQLSRAVL